MLRVEDVKIRLVSQGGRGQVAWASCTINGTILVQDLEIYRERSGWRLRFPGQVLLKEKVRTAIRAAVLEDLQVVMKYPKDGDLVDDCPVSD